VHVLSEELEALGKRSARDLVETKSKRYDIEHMFAVNICTLPSIHILRLYLYAEAATIFGFPFSSSAVHRVFGAHALLSRVILVLHPIHGVRGTLYLPSTKRGHHSLVVLGRTLCYVNWIAKHPVLIKLD
jgi:hypothetical protein